MSIKFIFLQHKAVWTFKTGYKNSIYVNFNYVFKIYNKKKVKYLVLVCTIMKHDTFCVMHIFKALQVNKIFRA